MKYFNVTKFVKKNFTHKVEPVQFKKFLKSILDFLEVDEREKILITTGRGRYSNIKISQDFLPLLAKWIYKKETKKMTIKKITKKLLFDKKFVEEYLEELPIS